MQWIPISEQLPPEGVTVDLWDGAQRYPDYQLTMNYGGVTGNNFFQPVRGGISVIRYDRSAYYTNATHWMHFEPPMIPQVMTSGELIDELNYWKQRCQLAEQCLDESPCDSDITAGQIKAHADYNEFLTREGDRSAEHLGTI